MSEIKILVVDDQRLIREGIASLLSIQKGLHVVGMAGNGKSAIEMAEKFFPDIILMDIRMPLMDGILATGEIIKKGIKCQIIMLTTFDDNEYILKSLKAGAIGYLLKDIPPEDLVGAIKMAFQGIYQLSSAAAGRLVGKLDQENPEDHVLLQNAKSIIWKLSEREREVLKSIAKGLTNKEIADALFITEGTVKNHVSNILASLNLRDRTQAALFVIKSKIL